MIHAPSFNIAVIRELPGCEVKGERLLEEAPENHFTCCGFGAGWDMEISKRAAIVGVTGFVGRGLPARLAAQGFAITGISRAGKGCVPGVDRWQTPQTMDFSGHDVVINLAGEPIDRRWTRQAKQRFRESRVGVTEAVVAAIARVPESARPKVLVNASGVGIYGDRGDELLTEESALGSDYLADLCRDWEAAADLASPLGVRVVVLRIGVVLGKKGGALKKLRTVFRLGIGGRLGSGAQWMPWIHLEDLQAAIVHTVVSPHLEGPLNACAPIPECNRDLTVKLARALHRPAIFSVPAIALRLMLGEFSSALLSSARAMPTALEADGFHWRFPTLEHALTDLTR
jgi:uncharacterized protein (TIGR01777 family)